MINFLEKLKFWNYIIFFGICFFLLCFFSWILVSTTISFKQKRIDINDSFNDLHEHEDTSKSITRTDTSFLGDPQLLNRYNEIGDHFQISGNPKEETYECIGSCYCEQNSNNNNNNDDDDEYWNDVLRIRRRRRSSTVFLTKGIIQLITAATSIIAIKKAINHFSEDCKDIMLDNNNEEEFCQLDSISAKVDDCKNIIFHENEKEKTKNNEKKKKENINFIPSSKYWCSGNCLTKESYLELHTNEDVWGCEEVEAAGEIVIYQTRAIKNQKQKDFKELAIIEFQNTKLYSSCQAYGDQVVEFTIMNAIRIQENTLSAEKWKNTLLTYRNIAQRARGPCASKVEIGDFINPSIRCEETK